MNGTNSQSITRPTLTAGSQNLRSAKGHRRFHNRFDLLQPLRRWLNNIEICDRKLARFLSKMIPAQCPFERDIVLFGRAIAHIPPLCKLNPLYEQFVGLRFRALCYLVDCCGEDIEAFV